MADKSLRIEVTGAKELRRKLKKAADEDMTAELAQAYDTARRIVVGSAKANAPILIGDLRDSIRGVGGKTRATVAAGKGRTTDYAGVIHYPNNRGIEPDQFLYDGLRDEWDFVYRTFDDAVDRVTDKL